MWSVDALGVELESKNQAMDRDNNWKWHRIVLKAE